MRTIYMVTEGSYSDYSVLCAFDKREDAETYAKSYTDRQRYSDDAEVEELDLFEEGDRPEPMTYTVLSGVVDAAGLRKEKERTFDWYPWSNDDPPKRPRVQSFYWGGDHEGRGPAYQIEVECTDTDLARKAYRDRVAKFRAELNGL